jgi:hypothetical protein
MGKHFMGGGPEKKEKKTVVLWEGGQRKKL